ncbi:hypothetical protein CLV92_12110 [Kineococcus xinjiangensis]|uniref:Uncharacterized protein n=1 Tax=Kineococcus xinjiangensis TaxID=512762 RepID=A0A2S6ICG2_9ACTN|nr:hypothetical protein CLV92_12110 [Kineococcus xinjiangensis]
MATLALGLVVAIGSAPRSETSCSDFAVSLVSDRGGKPSPVEAAEHLVRHRSVVSGLTGAWEEIERSDAAASVRQGRTVLHVVQGPEGTWQVDSGTCAPVR